MPRSLSLHRRRAGLIDLTLSKRDGVIAYQFKAATEFSGPFTTFATVPADGMKSVSVAHVDPVGSSSRGSTRFVFKPNDYSLTDTAHIWVRIAPVASDGSVGADEAPHLILPYDPTPNRTFSIAGEVGETPVELQLPRLCAEPVIQVSGTDSLFVTLGAGDTGFEVTGMSTNGYAYANTFHTFSQMTVYGSDANVRFVATFREVSGRLA